MQSVKSATLCTRMIITPEQRTAVEISRNGLHWENQWAGTAAQQSRARPCPASQPAFVRAEQQPYQPTRQTREQHVKRQSEHAATCAKQGETEELS